MSLDPDTLGPGSQVRLASGSPRMTVTGVVGPFRRVHVVVWSDRLGVVEADFDPACLVLPAQRPSFPPGYAPAQAEEAAP